MTKLLLPQAFPVVHEESILGLSWKLLTFKMGFMCHKKLSLYIFLKKIFINTDAWLYYLYAT